jgi:hypothetical protein
MRVTEEMAEVDRNSVRVNNPPIFLDMDQKTKNLLLWIISIAAISLAYLTSVGWDKVLMEDAYGQNETIVSGTNGTQAEWDEIASRFPQGDCAEGEVSIPMPNVPLEDFGMCVEKERLPVIFGEANRLQEETK